MRCTQARTPIARQTRRHCGIGTTTRGTPALGTTFDDIRGGLWGATDPFAGFPKRLFEVDITGWNAGHGYLSNTIKAIRPQVIVEVGVWKGQSAIFMANRLRELTLDAVVIGVDTWLGSWDHWTDRKYWDELCFDHGYPRLYDKFAANVLSQRLEGHIVPLPLDSVNARHVVSDRGIVADMIHLDGGHDYDAVLSDLTQWWRVLRDGGVLVCDDYHPDGEPWPGVKRAVDAFLGAHAHSGFAAAAAKCWVVKQPEAAPGGVSRAPIHVAPVAASPLG